VITTLAGGNNPPTRVVLFGTVGANLELKTLIRRIASNTGSDLVLTPALPAGYQVERLKIQQQAQQFTWLYTVRKDGSGATAAVDVVVFFRRSFAPAEETLYSATWQNAQVAGSGGAGSLGPQVTVTWTGAEPFYKKGSFVLDAVRGEWYRVVDVLATGTGTATLKLDRRVPAAYDRAVQNGAVPNGWAMFMRGVVDVYPIGTKTIQ
jgi:hypothetical protein